MPSTDDTTPVVEWRPTVKRVAKEIPARVRGRGGDRPDSFSTDTSPTADQVEGIIDDSLGEVAMAIGGYAVPTSCLDGARRLVALHAAATIESGTYPEQNGAMTGLAARLDRMYDRLLPLVVRCIATAGAGGPDTDPQTADEGNNPVWSFPAGREVAEGAERSLLGFPDPRRMW